MSTKDENANISSMDDSRRALFKYAGASAAVAALGASVTSNSHATTQNNSSLVNVADYIGSDISDSDAFENALNFAYTNNKGGIYIPPGTYHLETPVPVKAGVIISGFGGLDYGGQKGTIIKPTTVAFKPHQSIELIQESGFRIENIVFIGGTIPIDLGLRNNCIFRDLIFIDPEITSISIVRGERVEISNVTVCSSNNDCQYGLLLGTVIPETVITGIHGYDFGPNGIWVSNVQCSNLVFTSEEGSHIQYGLYCQGTLAHFSSQKLVCRGLRNSAIFIGKSLRYSNISDIIFDQCQSEEKLIDITKSYSNVFSEISPIASTSTEYAIGLFIKHASETAFINCNIQGDNISKFGFRFANDVGQIISMINCQGALYVEYNTQKSTLQQNRISQINCSWTATSTGHSTGLSASDGNNIHFQLMEDHNGFNPSTASVKINAAIGNGSSRTIVDASLESIKLGFGEWDSTPVKFGNIYEWYDSTGNKRAKNGKPNNEFDGVIISATPVI